MIAQIAVLFMAPSIAFPKPTKRWSVCKAPRLVPPYESQVKTRKRHSKMDRNGNSANFALGRIHPRLRPEIDVMPCWHLDMARDPIGNARPPQRIHLFRHGTAEDTHDKVIRSVQNPLQHGGPVLGISWGNAAGRENTFVHKKGFTLNGNFFRQLLAPFPGGSNICGKIEPFWLGTTR